ncbi:MAG: hypothetical protein Ct9H300mP27_12220 [Chloroflexota bacterium]|nr:MAG: hypothetical protein Ct9H300mP27_12220 [Chloroflexota bacterium]
MEYFNCRRCPGKIFEVTRDKEIVWEYINPFTSEKGVDLQPVLEFILMLCSELMGILLIIQVYKGKIWTRIGLRL